MAGVVDKKEVLELSGYLKNMFSRLQSLQSTARQISGQVNHLTANIEIKKKGFVNDLESIKKEVGALKEEVRSVQKATLHVINHLKNSVKADEFERFKKRMDLWAPESLVTKKEVKKVLK